MWKPRRSEQEQTEEAEISYVLSVTSCSILLRFQLMKKPGAGMGPIIVGGAGGNSEDFGGFFEGHADEISQFYQFGFGLVLGGEFVERIIYRQQLIIVARGGKVHVLDVHALLSAAVAPRVFAAGVINQDAAHRLGCCGEEMSAVLEFRVFLADQTQPSFMNQRRRLERLSGSLVRHPGGCQFAQLLIDQREEFVSGLRIALLDSRQDARYIAHG